MARPARPTLFDPTCPTLSDPFCAGHVCLTMCGFVSGNRARLSERAASPSMRPLGVYIYAVGPRSCRIRRAQKGSARLGPTKLRFCSKTLFLWAFRSAFGLAPQNATRFSAVKRPETKPRMAPLGAGLTAHAFVFVASALAAVPSARLVVGSHASTDWGRRRLAGAISADK